MPTKNDGISKLATGVQYDENPRYSFPERGWVFFYDGTYLFMFKLST